MRRHWRAVSVHDHDPQDPAPVDDHGPALEHRRLAVDVEIRQTGSRKTGRVHGHDRDAAWQRADADGPVSVGRVSIEMLQWP